MRPASLIPNILGAFSDGAVLFPILALLSMKAGFSTGLVLFSTGLVYLASAIVFRVPMAVQPLKSIAIAAVTVGATFQEVRWSGFFLGIVCLTLCLVNVDRFVKRVPITIIHQLQVGLGVLLMLQGVRAFGDWNLLVNSISGLSVLFASVLIVLFPEIRGLPLLGIIATLGLVASAFMGGQSLVIEKSMESHTAIRPQLIVGLLIPQVILTLSNSVIATQNVCERYFGNRGFRVNARRLLYSIGLGNVLVAAVGGMPFCHGSGGVTAHVRGGSTQAWSTALMGAFLLTLALLHVVSPAHTIMYPPFLTAVLLMVTGVLHLKLAAPTAVSKMGWIKLSTAFMITLVSHSLLWVLGGAVVLETSMRLGTKGEL